MTDAKTPNEPSVGVTIHDPSVEAATAVSVNFTRNFQIDGYPFVAEVHLTDIKHAGLEVVLKYLILGEDKLLLPMKFSVESVIENSQIIRLGPGVIRDLPLARWDRLAKAVILRQLPRAEAALGRWNPEDRPLSEVEAMQRYGDPSLAYRQVPAATPAERRRKAEELVRQRRPDLNPQDGRAAERSWNSLVRLAEYLDEHTEELAKGTEDPVSVMAERHEVAPATVRTWLHRGRQAGLAEPELVGRFPSSTQIRHADDVDVLLVDRILSEQRAAGDHGSGPQQKLHELGAIFKKAREATGRGVNDVSEQADLPAAFIEAIELGRFAGLERRAARHPHPSEYLPEALTLLADTVGLSPAELVEDYRHLRREAGIEPPLSIGEQLRDARRRTGLDTGGVAELSGLAPGIVKALEATDFVHLGAAAREAGMAGPRGNDLIKSYITKVGHVVGLDTAPLLHQYDHLVAGRATQTGAAD